QRPALARFGAALRHRRAPPAGAAAGQLDHAGQGQSRDPRDGTDGRGAGGGKSPGGDDRRHVGKLRAQRHDAGPRAEPARVDVDPRRRLQAARRPLRRRHRRRPRPRGRAGRALVRDGDGARAADRLRPRRRDRQGGRRHRPHRARGLSRPRRAAGGQARGAARRAGADGGGRGAAALSERASGPTVSAEPSPGAPPEARRVPHVREIHGDRFEDPWFWLRERDDPAVVAYLEAENAWAERVMAPARALRDELYVELVARVKEEDEGVPYPRGGWLYFWRIGRGQQHKVHLRRRREDGPEQVLVDLNELGRDLKY